MRVVEDIESLRALMEGGTQIADARVVGLDLSGVSFIDLGLSGVVFERCRFDDGGFVRSSLTAVSFESCQLSKTGFIECSLSTVVFRGGEAGPAVL
ncbi:MAG TPA: hypothetical protein DEF51_36225, partial [Myxococcales bacterium]|nr:hypothetical protein [Myxococcales bacterium]